MTYACPHCAFGHLQPIKRTYVRQIDTQLLTIPNFPLWRCDSCGYTRYDQIALSRLEALIGPDTQDWDTLSAPPSRRAEGPAATGPQRWPF